ncbi:AMP-binding protein [Mycobacterium sp. BMJ-28]
MTTGNVLLDNLLLLAETQPDSCALIDASDGSRLTFRELVNTSAAAADWLRANGGVPNTNVILTIPLSKLFVQLCFGAFMNGMVPALLDASAPSHALSPCVKELSASLWISSGTAGDVGEYTTVDCQERFYELYEYKVHSDRKSILDPVLILYTSGTTGIPKGVPWTGRELSSQIELYARDAVSREFCLFGHLALVAIAMGRTAVLPCVTSLQPQLVDISAVAQQMSDYGSDYVFASPLFWDRLIKFVTSTDNKSSIDIGIAATAGSAVSGRLIERFQVAFPATQMRIPYASTEVLMPITSISAEDYIYLSRLYAYSGRGVPLGRESEGMYVEIVPTDFDRAEFSARDCILEAGDIGEILVTGPRATQRYFRRTEIEAHAKLRDVLTERIWHRTGDMGFKDESGCLWFVCRKKDVVSTPFGVVYPDALEQMWNMSTGATLSAVVYSQKVDRLLYVLPVDTQAVVDKAVLKIQAERLGIPSPVVITLEGLIPADRRHNSKIDRAKTLEMVELLLTDQMLVSAS